MILKTSLIQTIQLQKQLPFQQEFHLIPPMQIFDYFVQDIIVFLSLMFFRYLKSIHLKCF
jgi:hypothetical protein